MNAPVDIGHLRDWIGQEETASEVLTPVIAARYRATVGGREGEVAPRLIHWCLTLPSVANSVLGPDGHPRRGGFLPPVPLPRRMWAGGELSFEGELRVGDEVIRRSRIADVVLKEGRSGRLCFVTVAHEIEARGQVVVRERQDIVYRDPPGDGAPKPPPPAAEGAARREMEAGTAFLFRYSALTFNAHRIHYDRDYATGTEGYDGLVVHGPLQAALLYAFAAELRGALPDRFSFRGASPLTDTAPFFLNSDGAKGPMRLWTARAGGPEAMVAEAHWG